MAKRPSSRRSGDAKGGEYTLPEAETVADEIHPDFQDGLISDFADDEIDELGEFTPNPTGPFPGPFPGPIPQPQPLPVPRLPQPRPIPGIPGRFPQPIRFCGPVSGRYRLRPVFSPSPFPAPHSPRPFTPINATQITVRVDVDRYYPQRRISIEATRIFPRMAAHAIAVVTSDVCLGLFRRRIEARINYRDGNAALIPGNRLIFEAFRGTGFGYSTYRLRLIDSGGTTRTYNLAFQSQYFDPVEFEVDAVANAGAPVTTYATGSHPNRPAGLPSETLSLRTTYQRAGFDVTMSPNTSTIPVSGAGANATWSDAEMHNAMVTFWSRFANRPRWAMWVLFAARHDRGRGLGGIMFDDIGANHRQGTAIFTDSFIQDVPSGDANPAAWRRRMVYWTAVHEMGHAFNLAHAWQKALGRPQVDGDPWIPLANDNEARSFMNYPFRVSGGQSAFFADFDFRFTNDELIFMRHAPRRFVQMGNEDWFENHGFEDDSFAEEGSPFTLQLRPNRESNGFKFLEPVSLELKLTNTSGEAQAIDEDCLADGRHVAIVVRRDGGRSRKWRPFTTYCHELDAGMMKPGESRYASHFVGASTDGWLIDEPGFYLVQAAVEVGGEVVRSNALRIFVSQTTSEAENKVAPDYFSEDVARVLAFQGAPALDTANDTLKEVIARCASNPAATHAAIALSSPLLRQFKTLKAGETRDDLAFGTSAQKLSQASKVQVDALVKQPDAAAETLGHIPYFDTLERLSGALADEGDKKEAASIQQSAVQLMAKRGVLKSVIDAAKRRLARMK
jgi:hypothetical protein